MKKYIITLACLFIVLGFSIFYFACYTKVDVTMKDISLKFNDKAFIKDYVSVKDGSVDNHLIKTTKLGKSSYKVKVQNKYHYEKEYTYSVNVVDEVAPAVFVNSKYTVYAPYSGNLLESIMIGDNDTDRVKKELIGSYDGNVPGEYPLKIVATDNSGNKTEKDFVLVIKEKAVPNNSLNSNTDSKIELKPFSSYKEKYSDNKVGIDVSKWQGDIDFNKVKAAGADFVILRVGVQGDYGAENKLDPYFKQNIEKASAAGLDIGLYFYSCATSKSEAKKQAKWVKKQIGDYKISLPIAFDWENWRDFNNANLSFYSLTEVANAFMNEIKKDGYDTLLYGSKNYLENIWLDTEHSVWLAHYTISTTYEGDYKLWQITEHGQIDGIDGAVDIDIMY